MQILKPNIFDYLNYRKFLGDFYTINKQNDPSFSLRSFSRRAGLKSYNYLKLVSDGKRRLSESMLPEFVKGLKLNTTEEAYMRELLHLDRCEKLDEKSESFQRLLKLRPGTEK